MDGVVPVPKEWVFTLKEHSVLRGGQGRPKFGRVLLKGIKKVSNSSNNT